MNIDTALAHRTAAARLLGPLAAAFLLIGCTRSGESTSEHGHDEADHAEQASDAATGPHGGRFVDLGDYRVEVAIFETGVLPEFRVYATDPTGKPVRINPILTSIVLTRPDRADTYTFQPAGDFVASREDIAEPHEFGVALTVGIGGQKFDTTYFQEEAHAHGHDQGAGGSLGAVTIAEEALKRNRVKTAIAGPGTIAQELELPGEITLNADKVAHIVPRFPGIALKVMKNLGDEVRTGDVLAILQSNVSVAPYEVTSLIDGVIIEKHITLGEFVRDDEDIFVMADLSTVWVQISIYAKYLPLVKPGLHVRFTAQGIEESASGVIDYVGPIVGEATRTGLARVVLKNPKGLWQPGLFVAARVAREEVPVELAVPDDAIQTVEGRTVVFVREGNEFEVREVELGRSDGRMVEILAGLLPGDEYVSANSFLFKAEFGKSEAGHDH